MGKNNGNDLKYRLIVAKESRYGGWSDVVWEGDTKWDSELEEKYCFWLNKKCSKNTISEEKEVNGSKLEIAVDILDVNLQIGNYDKKNKKYNWKDHDYKTTLDKVKISMR